jgi:hypothetical protein
MILIERLIFDGSDPPHIPPIPYRDEKIHIRMFMKGMLLPVEVHVSIHMQRRHPLRTILI